VKNSWILLGSILLFGPRPLQAAPQQAVVEAEKPNLGGRWQLNPDQSDDARKKMRDAMTQAREAGGGGGGMGGGMGGGGRHGGGMGGGGGRRGGGGRPSSGSDSPGGGTLGAALEAPSKITVAQVDPEVVITDGDGRVRTLYGDGRKVKSDTASGTVETSTKWDHGRLVSENKTNDGAKVTEIYSLSPDKRQLFVNVRLEGSRMPVTVAFRRVYDVVEDK